MGVCRGQFVSAVAISLSLFVWTGAEVTTESPRPLRLNVYDYAGVAPDVREAAADAARQVFAAIGVDIVWVERCPVACRIAFSREAYTDPTGGGLTVFVLPPDMTSREFPSTMLGNTPEKSEVAYAFFDRIRAVAFDHDLPLATLLGHVIAHEVGHILLREGHAAEGLMRDHWVYRDLLLATRGRLGFTATQGGRIRSRLGAPSVLTSTLDSKHPRAASHRIAGQ